MKAAVAILIAIVLAGNLVAQERTVAIFTGQSKEPLVLKANVDELPETELLPVSAGLSLGDGSQWNCGTYFQGTALRRNVDIIYFVYGKGREDSKIFISYPFQYEVLIDNGKQTPTVELKKGDLSILLKISQKDYDQAPCLPGII
jgi:hypothetical protein